MSWTTTEELSKELCLTSDPHDYDSLKRELRMRLAEIHPDKNGGIFIDRETQAKFIKLSSAYEFVIRISDDSHALIPVAQIPAIIKAVREAQEAPTQMQINTLKTECRIESRVIAHNRNILPKIGSGTFATVCAFLFTFSGTVAEHPILGPIAKSRNIQIGLLVAAICAGFFFVFTWLREKKEETKVEWLISEQGLRYICDELIRESHHPVSGNKNGRFSARKVVDMLIGKSSYQGRPLNFIRASLLISCRRISISIAEKIAEVHLMELEKRGAIHRVEYPSIEAEYEFDHQVIKAATNK